MEFCCWYMIHTPYPRRGTPMTYENDWFTCSVSQFFFKLKIDKKIIRIIYAKTESFGLIYFSVKSVLVRKTPQILTIYVYQWQKRHQTRTCLAFYTKNCLSYRYGPHPKRCRRLDVRIGSEDLQTRSEHFPPMSS